MILGSRQIVRCSNRPGFVQRRSRPEDRSIQWREATSGWSRGQVGRQDAPQGDAVRRELAKPAGCFEKSIVERSHRNEHRCLRGENRSAARKQQPSTGTRRSRLPAITNLRNLPADAESTPPSANGASIPVESAWICRRFAASIRRKQTAGALLSRDDCPVYSAHAESGRRVTPGAPGKCAETTGRSVSGVRIARSDVSQRLPRPDSKHFAFDTAGIRSSNHSVADVSEGLQIPPSDEYPTDGQKRSTAPTPEPPGGSP